MSKQEQNTWKQGLNQIREMFDVQGFNMGIVYKNIRFVMFISVLALIYIANTHYAERNMREVNDLQKELKELSWQYMTSKSESMFKTKQTEVAKKVQPLGLKKPEDAPLKIKLK